MNDHQENKRTGPTIADLYPSLDEGQRLEAEENLKRYVALALRIYERIRLEPHAPPQPEALTSSAETRRIESERSNPLETKQLP